ncbi:hypothetical protein GQ53DRAFT_804047 [Thozetella sp. PMI_491]|nr:hypothetical protein GQ53DRAFT_804047 [Thozetella sp. PMI_491]
MQGVPAEALALFWHGLAPAATQMSKYDLLNPSSHACKELNAEAPYGSGVSEKPLAAGGDSDSYSSPGLSHDVQDAGEQSLVRSSTLPTSLDYPLYRGQNIEASDRILEQRLFHAFIRRIRKDDVTEGIMVPRGFWDCVPTMGFEYPGIIHGAMGLGAASEALERDHGQSMVAISLGCLTRSIDLQMAAVQQGVTEQNFDALYASAIFISSQAVMHRALPPFDRTSLAGVVDWFRCWYGIRTLAGASPGLFSKSMHKNTTMFLRHAPREDRKAPARRSEFDYILRALPRMSTPRKTYRAHQDVVAYLDEVYEQRTRALHIRFPLHAPTTFVKCVERCELTALTLMGTWFGLARIMDIPFAFDFSAEVEIRRILGCLPSLHRRLLDRALAIIEARRAQKTPEPPS